jgi:hypothetical protein
MDEGENVSGKSVGASSGPLRIHRDEEKLVVVGFGLWIPVRTEKEGSDLIAELEDQGYRICY